MLKKYQIIFLILLLSSSVSYGQNENFLIKQIKESKDTISFFQIKTDSIFDSKQIISFISLPKKYLSKFQIKFAYHKSGLTRTSTFAKNENALAALNGGFFNVKTGMGVSYFELNDTLINRTIDPKLKWNVKGNLINGAIILSKNSEILLQKSNSDQFYELSKQEAAVLVTGPLLLSDTEKVEMPDIEFVNNRHPRTCLCLTEKSVIFLTIDGRSLEAEGMNLYEVQDFLLKIACLDAINLDGGGSTTMWTHDKGIVNFPSDKSGERAVANAILILNYKDVIEDSNID